MWISFSLRSATVLISCKFCYVEYESVLQKDERTLYSLSAIICNRVHIKVHKKCLKTLLFWFKKGWTLFWKLRTISVNTSLGNFHKFFEFSLSYYLLLLVFLRVPCSSGIPIRQWRFFFDQHLNGEIYLCFFQEDFLLFLENIDLDMRARMWWQDRTTAHSCRNVTNYLRMTYGVNWIGRRGPIICSFRSLDLTFPDFFLVPLDVTFV